MALFEVIVTFYACNCCVWWSDNRLSAGELGIQVVASGTTRELAAMFQPFSVPFRHLTLLIMKGGSFGLPSCREDNIKCMKYENLLGGHCGFVGQDVDKVSMMK